MVLLLILKAVSFKGEEDKREGEQKDEKDGKKEKHFLFLLGYNVNFGEQFERRETFFAVLIRQLFMKVYKASFSDLYHGHSLKKNILRFFTVILLQ